MSVSPENIITTEQEQPVFRSRLDRIGSATMLFASSAGVAANIYVVTPELNPPIRIASSVMALLATTPIFREIWAGYNRGSV